MPLSNEDVRQLAYAVAQNDLDKMDSILAKVFSYVKKSEVNKYETYFEAACINGLHMVVDKYLDYRQFDQSSLDTGLYEISVLGDTDIAKILVGRCKIDLNKTVISSILRTNSEGKMFTDLIPRYPIEIAANNDNPELVEYYLNQPRIVVNNIFSQSFTTGLTSFVAACMGGKGFVPLVLQYIERGEFEKDKLYQAIYLAARFENAAAIQLIIEKCDQYLDSDVAIKVMDQGYADAKTYFAQPGNAEKGKIDQQKAAVAEMKMKLSGLIGNIKLEHSSDEEVSNGSGSESPKRLSDSDEPQSAGSDSSNNSPPPSPPKLTQPPRPLSEKAKMLLSKMSPDKALSVSRGGAFGADVPKEIIDAGGITFKEFEKDNANVFQVLVLTGKEEVASYLLSKYPCIDFTNPDGRTALHLTIVSGEDKRGTIEHRLYESSTLDTVNYLLANKATINIKDRFQKTPIDYANERGYTRVAALLTQRNIEQQAASNSGGVLRQPEITYLPSTQRQPASTTAPVSLGNAKAGMFTLPVVQPQPVSQFQPQLSVAPPVTQNNRTSTVGAVHAPPPKTAANQQYQEKKKSAGVFGSLKGLISGSKKEEVRVSKSP